jgi:hypothetical protein
MSASDLLAQVDQAISDLLVSGVAKMGDDGRTYEMNNLGELRRLRSELQQEVAAQSGASFRLFRPI